MSDSLLWNILVVLVVVGLIAHSIHDRRRRKRLLQECAERLGLQGFKETYSSLSGVARGLPLHVNFVAQTKNRPAHTTIDVTIEPCPFLLHLRLQTAAEEELVRRGEAVDLTIGDPELDGAWIIEGAPPERVIRVLSSPALRAKLEAFSDIEDATVTVEEGKVSVHRRGTEVGADAVAIERIELALDIAQAVIEDARTPLQAGDVDPAASTYRTVRRADPDASAAAKLAELKLLRATRALSQLQWVAIAGHVFPVLMILGVQLPGTSPPLAALPILAFMLIATLGVLRSYHEHKKSAPSVQLPPWTARIMVLGWAVAVILLLRGFLMP